jgi:hypothetical protein
MAPIIPIPAQDTLKTIQNALKKSIDTNRILKKRENMHIREDYQVMEVDLNNKLSLAPLNANFNSFQ